jgi:hypothetical protein
MGLPDVKKSSFEIYALAVRPSASKPISSYVLLDWRRMRDWVLQFDARDHSFHGKKRWRAKALKPNSTTFLWGNETPAQVAPIEASRRIALRNVAAFLENPFTGTQAEVAREIQAASIHAAVGDTPNDETIALVQAVRRLRRGGRMFRKKMLALYDGLCAVTGEGPRVVLEAAHIQDHSVAGLNASENGLLLRSDLHVLFDLGLLKIEPGSLRIHIDPSLAGTQYAALADPSRVLRKRTDGSHPSDELLRRRWAATSMRLED